MIQAGKKPGEREYLAKGKCRNEFFFFFSSVNYDHHKEKQKNPKKEKKTFFHRDKQDKHEMMQPIDSLFPRREYSASIALNKPFS